MKIGYILTTYPSRSELFVAREIGQLQRSGFDVVVLASGQDEVGSLCGAAPVTYYRPSRFSWLSVSSVGHILLRYPLGFLRWLGLALELSDCRDRRSLLANLHTVAFFLRCLERHGIRHIHACFLSWPALMALGISTLSGRTYSIGVHARDVFVEQGDAELKVSRSRFVAGCTRQALDHLQTHVSPKCTGRFHLNPHGLEVPKSRFRSSRVREEERVPTPVSRILGVGRLVPKKGFANLLQAFSSLLSSHPDCRLQLVGDGPQRESLGLLAGRLSIANAVDFLGWRAPASVERLLEGAAMLVVPSVITEEGDRDGLPNVVLEAFAVGTPVIASRLPGISEAVEHGVNGILTEPGNVEAIVSAAEHLLSNPRLARELTRNAYETLVGRFDLRTNVGELGQLFLGVR